jgi:hypothetical protein
LGLDFPDETGQALENTESQFISNRLLSGRAGYGDSSQTDTLAVRGTRAIGLVYHGSRKLTEAQLTEAQEEYFS